MISPEFTSTLETTYARLQLGLTKKSRDYNWRISQLRALQSLLEQNETTLCEAMWNDLRKSKFECAATEQGVVLSEIRETVKNLRSWMKPRKVSTPLFNQIGTSHICHEPYGLTLIIGAWNYPINLLLAPLVGAISGGNGAIIKPSEISAHTARLITQLVPQYLDPDLFAVIEGGAEETGALLDKKFDMIFFTGSGTVGKIILAKAAVHLTPTILELGGKSPGIVWKDADLTVAARRLAWGKFMNAGQTCVAPDYIIVHPDVKQKLIKKLCESLRAFYGEKPMESPDYCRIINEKNFDRLQKVQQGLTVLCGGDSDRENLFISPTLVEADGDSVIMQDEIFGPILPILTMSDRDQVTSYIRSRPKPLALYLFTKDKTLSDFVISSTSSGAVCVNDNVIHLPQSSLPFGGVGASGMGNYHGRFSFETFTHAKAVLRKSFWFDVPFRYPPYNLQKARWLKWLLK